MKYIFLNCNELVENFLTCSIEYWKFYDFDNIMVVVTMSMSAIGIILNLITNFIFFSSKNFNTKFLNLLKYYAVNSMVVNLNSFILSLIFFRNKSIYITRNNNYFSSYNWTYYFTHPYLLIWTISYTFSGVLDIFIVQDRIQMMQPKMNFLKKLSSRMISFLVLVFCCLVNIPVNMARQVKTTTITLSNRTTEVYQYDIRKYHHQTIFMISVYFANFIRDIVPFLLETIVNIILIFVTISFYKKKRQLTNSFHQGADKTVFRRTSINNTKIAFIIGIISALIHVFNFSLLIILITLPDEIYYKVGHVMVFLHNARHALGIFIYLKLNKKFRGNFFSLMPKSIDIYFQKNKSVTTIKLIEHINKKTETAKL